MSKNLGHVMIDIETLGSTSYSCITSVAAVEFDINTGETGRRFHEKVNLQSNLNVGLKVNPSTLSWWLQQNEKARLEMSDDILTGLDLPTALYHFNKFLEELGFDICLWGNSARFDLGILHDAYEACHYGVIPWSFRNERCVRTLVAFAPEIKSNTQRIGTEHSPIDDCLHQITYCTKIWQKLSPYLQVQQTINKAA